MKPDHAPYDPDDDAPIYEADVVEHLALIGEFDARKWAATFVATVRDNPLVATDVETMVAWFASAIMAGYDRARRTPDPCSATPPGSPTSAPSRSTASCAADATRAPYVNRTRPLTRWRKASRWRWRIECKLADAWLGVYLAPDETWRSGTVWVCVVPCLPIHIDWCA